MAVSGVAFRRLCIVSRDRPLSGASVAALATALGPGEELEIIMDRRGEKASTQPPTIERRHHPEVDLALQRDGFAIVPAQHPRPAAPAPAKSARVPAPPPVERLALNDADARELERVLGFKRRRKARLTRQLMRAGLLIGILALLAVSLPVRTIVDQARSIASRIESPPPKPAPPVAVTPSPKPEPPAPSRVVRSQHSEERPRETSASTPTPSSTSAPSASKPAAAQSAADPPVRETPAKETSAKGASAKETPPKVGPPPVVGLPQVDVTRNPASTSEGGGETYVVRVSDQSGRPAVGVLVSLLVRMANGTLLDIPLGSGTEPGAYTTTVPPLDSAPLDLRIRVVAGNRRVEIPLAP